MPPRSGGRLLVDQLVVQGAELAFCVPGESYLPVLDALYDVRPMIRLVTCRHEGAAANMADGYGKLTGRPGICLVTRAPGATQAAVGVHTAAQDSTPLLLLVGQPRRGVLGREAFQELDVRAVFGPIAKWAAQVEEPERIPELVHRAFQTATSGRPGPVVLGLPEDVLAATVTAADARPYAPVRAHPGEADLARLGELLAAARRPVALVGGAGWSGAAARDLLAAAEAAQLPLVTAWRRQDAVDNHSPCYAGAAGIGIDPALAARLSQADLLLVVGPRLGEVTTSGYSLPRAPRPDGVLVHVHAGAEELGSVYQPDLAINAGMAEFAAALRALPLPAAPWQDWATGAHEDHLRRSTPPASDAALDLGAVARWVGERLGPDGILTNGAGNYAIWFHRFVRFRRYGTQLAPTSGAMGYALPAALAAKLTRPQALVVAASGDGDFLMSGQELATAVAEQLAVVVLVVNNAGYGTIRMHQERAYPGRRIATALVNPDFAAYARSFGAHGEVVERTDAFPAAFERSVAAGGPALLELRVDPDQLTPEWNLREGPAPGAR